MKKILFFTQNLDFGGVQKSVATLANFFSKKYKVSIILAESNKPIKHKITKKIKIHTIKTLLIDTAKKDIGKFLFSYRANELQKFIDLFSPNLLISYEDYNNLISLKTTGNHKKIISCRVSLDTYKKGLSIHLLDDEFYLNNIKQYYNNADKILCVSKSIENDIILLNNSCNTLTIYNGIKKSLQNDEDIKYSNFIVTIGRLHTQKGHIDLIKAYNKIKNSISEKLLIIGEGKEKEILKKLIIKLGLEDRVILVGYQENTLAYLSKSSLFIFPSYYEGFSNVILEAIDAKCGVISYKYKGSEEILNDYDNLCEISDIETLSKNIMTFLLDPKKKKELIINQYNDIQKFNLENTLLQYDNLINSTL